MSVVEDTYRKKNWVIRLVDLIALCDRAYKRLDDSMLGHWLLERRRARKARKKGPTCA